MIVEFWFDVSTLQRALSRSPSMTVEMESITSTDTVPLRKLFWAYGGDFDAFETGLDEDPTIEDPCCLTKANDNRLYRITNPNGLPGVEAYHAVVELDGIILSATSNGDGWKAKLHFPDRDAISEWRERCENAGLEIDVQAIYSQACSPPERGFGLTEQQREALLMAADVGYFLIPRETTLAELANELGVSSQAVSERLRRGMEKLVSNALQDEGSPSYLA